MDITSTFQIFLCLQRKSSDLDWQKAMKVKIGVFDKRLRFLDADPDVFNF